MTTPLPGPTLPLGYLTHVTGPGGPARAYRETVDLAVAAEEFGFSSFWVAQHHGGALDGLLPSPLVLLAAVAERTSVIRLGTAVVAAALEDPIRLAEDVAVLDALSGGRVELGVGAGADPAASATFGLRHERRHQDCRAVVDELCRLLEDPATVPPAPGLRDRLWWATGSPAGVDAAAARGIGVLSGRAEPEVAAELEHYWARAAGEPRVAACRLVEAGETASAFGHRWRTDPVQPWAGELIVQTRPPDAGFAEHVATMRALGPSGTHPRPGVSALRREPGAHAARPVVRTGSLDL
jgi:alkanesulfonate monooxygenase SsuD/methylene tetrahydromethanopterin reductase-like flavin-dependent oxidoreductase (luciferase family)